MMLKRSSATVGFEFIRFSARFGQSCYRSDSQVKLKLLEIIGFAFVHPA
jgi:hypothetical protein